MPLVIYFPAKVLKCLFQTLLVGRLDFRTTAPTGVAGCSTVPIAFNSAAALFKHTWPRKCKGLKHLARQFSYQMMHTSGCLLRCLLYMTMYVVQSFYANVVANVAATLFINILLHISNCSCVDPFRIVSPEYNILQPGPP